MTDHSAISAGVALLPEMKRLCKGTTDGPWQLRERFHEMDGLEIIGGIDGDANDDGTLRMICTNVCEVADNEDGSSNADFILFARNNARTIIAALEALKPMADVVMVPREPTEAMMWAGQSVCLGNIRLAETYRAMLDAAPPASPDAVERVALDLYNLYRVRCKMPPVDSIGSNNTPECNQCREDARAAIAAIGRTL